jgi:hypothetical protein
MMLPMNKNSQNSFERVIKLTMAALRERDDARAALLVEEAGEAFADLVAERAAERERKPH